MTVKLHRFLVLALMCVGLGFAGVPAMACCASGAPVHDCCPGNSEPHGEGSGGPAAHVVAGCCLTEASLDAAAMSIAATSPADFEPTRADPPLPSTRLATLNILLRPTQARDASPAPSQLLALPPLYLSTGRLRL